MKRYKRWFIVVFLVLGISVFFAVYFIQERQEFPSEKKPYYLEVQRYRFVHIAKSQKKRLNKLGVFSFYIPLKDPDTGTWIVVGAGPVKDKDEAEKLKAKLASFRVDSVLNVGATGRSPLQNNNWSQQQMRIQYEIQFRYPSSPFHPFKTLRLFPTRCIFCDDMHT